MEKQIAKFAISQGRNGMNRVETIRATATKFKRATRAQLMAVLVNDVGLNYWTVRTQIQVARSQA